ncbi:MAG TPA: hypothetical protein VE818_14005 [Nitrososphaeraceae archaeon]|nr:hypothetical protein [Nitrososphaeraceae archaeon]
MSREDDDDDDGGPIGFDNYFGNTANALFNHRLAYVYFGKNC